MIATKVNGRMRPGPNGARLSRVSIICEIDASLTRLGADPYEIHPVGPRCTDRGDDKALLDHVRAGRVRCVETLPMWA